MLGTVVLVTQNHAQSISAVLGELAAGSSELIADGVMLDVLVVDAGSTDATVRIATDVAETLGLELDAIASAGSGPWVTQRDGFAHVFNRGVSDFVVTIDPAGHHDGRQLPGLVRSFRSKGSGLTIGSRWVRGGSAPGTSRPRAVLSRLASFFVARVTGLRRVSDVTTSFRVIRSDAAGLVTDRPATTGEYGFYCEFAAAAQAYGFTVDEVPITFSPRFAEVQPLRLSDLTEFWVDLRRIRTRIRAIRRDMAVDQATWAARSGRMREQTPVAGSEFGALDELTELSKAGNFTSWIFESLDERMGLASAARVLEVGAGLGAIATEIAGRNPNTEVHAIEPAANVFPQLYERAHAVQNLVAEQLLSSDAAARGDRFDAVVYVNVLEHIADDSAELEIAASLLEPGGCLGLFVPAMPSLYGSLDYKSGHYRRYTCDQLAGLLLDAGFVDVDVRYFDAIGVIPYWLMYRLANVSRLDRVSSTGYDRVVVPLSRAVQRVIARPPRGKNLVATARRPG